MRRLGVMLLIGLCTVIDTGCASFRRDQPDVQPAQLLRPTTMSSNEVADTGTLRGKLYAVFVELPVRLYRTFQGDTPSAQALALEDSSVPDRRRMGINELADHPFGKGPPYTTRYRQIAQFDADPLVRATALRALNRARDGTATGVFVDALADENASVRLEAAKALANVPDPNAVPGLLKVFNGKDEDPDVRIAAANAMRQYRNLEVARALVGGLTDRDFAVAWQSRQSLRTMTGDDRHYDQSAWLELVSGPNSPLG